MGGLAAFLLTFLFGRSGCFVSVGVGTAVIIAGLLIGLFTLGFGAPKPEIPLNEESVVEFTKVSEVRGPSRRERAARQGSASMRLSVGPIA